ncbi:MAG: hypothetical protein B5766_05270 [Candidatus Lumbricidophila eiseniae]|uniref:Phage tail lysozyme domain-containing protein n=1 Tax=Candidatus Lumbricidiphila eiseniae TaxID=1969409 RepID=A0A2A6FRX7_9MICO|nr:MAG: hypothetical protein B5766_05270 [Candidatus Lumbricidophila eiseniae]
MGDENIAGFTKVAASGAGASVAGTSGNSAKAVSAGGAEILGQGGTSTLSKTVESGGAEGVAGVEGRGLGKEVAKVGGAAAFVGGAQQVFTFMLILNWLKMMWATLVAVVQNFLAMVGAWVMNGVSQITGFFTSVGAFIGNALGISTMAGALSSGISAIVVGAFLISGLLLGLGSSGAAQHEGAVVDCRVGSVQTAAMDNADPNGVKSVQLENAKMVYSVFSAWGMSDANIAGILGNWQAESGIDPTSVQGIYESAYQMTDAKKSGAQNTDNGIGLGQWSFGRNSNLRDFASASGKNWWSLTTQLAFTISSTEGGNAQIVKGMVSTDQGTPAKAAIFFHDEWERSADTTQMAQRRANYAATWFAMMSGWRANKSLADSVLAQAGTTLGDANRNQVEKAKSSCRRLDTQNVMLKDGGMTKQEAQKLVDLYNQEADTFLDGRYGQYGGPASCGDNHAMNCVSFSTYFLNKYTTYQQYPWGDGIDTARTVSKDTGKQLQNTPVAYSVASGSGSSSAGHTLIVLGVQGDQVIIGEAGYCSFAGRIRVDSAAGMKAAGWVFVDLNDMMLATEQVKQS